MHAFYRAFLPFFAIFTLAAVSAPAKPNFSGDWKLNVAKSDFGQFPAPDSLTQKVAHEDPSLKVSSKMSSSRGEFTYEANYTTDGKECVNQFRNMTNKSTLKWEADTLVIDTKAKLGENDLTIHDKWTLSEDGKTLTMLRHFAGPQGEMDQKLIMEKQ